MALIDNIVWKKRHHNDKTPIIKCRSKSSATKRNESAENETTIIRPVSHAKYRILFLPDSDNLLSLNLIYFMRKHSVTSGKSDEVVSRYPPERNFTLIS